MPPRPSAPWRVLRGVAVVAGLAFLLAATHPSRAVAADTGAIGGRVTDEVTLAAVPDANVYLWRFSPSAGPGLGYWREYRKTKTDALGDYSIADLPAGMYRVEFWLEGYHGEFYNNEVSPTTADYVVVDSNSVTVNAALAPRSKSLRGTVTGPGGVPAEGVLVTAYWPYLGDYIEQDWTLTAADGTYTLHDLGTGNYAIEFWPFEPDPMTPLEPYLIKEYYDDKATMGSANLVPTIPGIVTENIDAELAAKTPTLFGWVKDQDTSASLSGIDVRLRSASSGAVVRSMTTTDGYVFYDVLVGSYKLEFFDNDPSDGSYETEWYFEKSSSSAANVVTITTDVQNLELSDQFLALGEPGIEGTVTRAHDDAPLEGIKVDAYRYDDASSSWQSVRWDETDSLGAYSLHGLPNGTYRVGFTEAGGEYVSQYWSGESSLVGGDEIAYSGTLVSDIDASLAWAAATPERVWARTRFSTAAAIAYAGFPKLAGIDTVIVASGDDRAAADPLAASGLCWLYDAPLFLVSAKSTPDEVKKSVRDIVAVNGPIDVRVVGGPVSVPSARVNEIKSYVEGYFGRTGLVSWGRVASTGGRYYLARRIAEEMKSRAATHGKTLPGFALIANGADSTKFFDALALSPIAASKGAPVLLVEAGAVPGDTSSALASIAASKCIIGGGPNTVGSNVKSTLAKKYTVVQWYGRSRYDTAEKIADEAIGAGYLTPSAVGVAAKLPDALSGGAMVGQRDGVLLLTRTDYLTTVTARWLAEHRGEVRECYVFGGPNSVKAAVFEDVEAILDF
ncbi:MAG: carboxypeptidase regulatory-like domain-containing protein [Coriobacteriia bacterium]|nr:carboxypeptidase regulatory-like domain-containing protein [Coriobacteriia bacterium]